MTRPDIDGIAARAKVATPGPWLSARDRWAAGEPHAQDGTVLDHEGCEVWPWEREEDMTFAYKAREDVPALIAYVRELEAKLSASEAGSEVFADLMDGNEP